MNKTGADEFHNFLQRMRHGIKKLDRLRLTDDEEAALTLNLTEIYFRAREVSEHIGSIANHLESRIDDKAIDDLETLFINLRIEMFDELIEWMLGVEKPLVSTIEKIGNGNSDESG